MPPLVAVRSLTRTFDDRVAIQDVSFDLSGGEIVALLGPNGAGKTTTLRLLSGLLTPTSGSIEVDGVALTPASASGVRSRIGLLTETPGLWDRLTVEANLLVYAQLHGLTAPAARVDTLLRTFELADRRADPAGTLSKGMKQKVALARALLHEPSVVLLDEPTAGLDPHMTRTVRGLIEEMRTEGRAVLVSTHNLDEAERLADRVAVLRQQLVAIESPDALRQRLFGSRVRVGFSSEAAPFVAIAADAGVTSVLADGTTLLCALARPADDVPRLVRALVLAGAEIRSVTEEHAALEDIYLSLVGDSTN